MIWCFYLFVLWKCPQVIWHSSYWGEFCASSFWIWVELVRALANHTVEAVLCLWRLGRKMTQFHSGSLSGELILGDASHHAVSPIWRFGIRRPQMILTARLSVVAALSLRTFWLRPRHPQAVTTVQMSDSQNILFLFIYCCYCLV